jgi:hypothetical protein
MNSRVILSKNIKMDREYVNVLSYSESKIVTLCLQNIVKESSNFSFIRANKSIQVPFSYGECLQANYIAFQNPDYSNKWFFAWIDEVIYKGDSNTEIKYTIDSWSTWFDKWTKKPCFIQREHTNDDTVGTNTIPENLNIGQLICDNVQNPTIIGAESFYWFVIACNYNPSNETRYAGVGMYGDYPQGNMWFAWLVNILEPAETINEISEWIFNITQDGQADNIQTIFTLPYQAFSLSDVDSDTHLVSNGKGNKLNEDLIYTKSLIRNFSDYIPKNKKLLTYPYSFIRVTNNLGSYNDYKIEDFHITDIDGNEVDEVVFNAIGVPCQGYSGKLRPKQYQGLLYNEDESIALGKYPTLSWSSDGFTNWLTQNAINLGISAFNTALSGATSIAGGIATANPVTVAGGIGTVASNTAGIIGSIMQSSMGSNTARGNANAGDVSFSQNLIRFRIMHMRPKKEFLLIIDDFFSRFGYATNRVKLPNITGRQNFNYVEIGQAEEIGYGEVPSIFMNNINNACRRGVTIWHNHENLGNYNIENNII